MSIHHWPVLFGKLYADYKKGRYRPKWLQYLEGHLNKQERAVEVEKVRGGGRRREGQYKEGYPYPARSRVDLRAEGVGLGG